MEQITEATKTIEKLDVSSSPINEMIDFSTVIGSAILGAGYGYKHGDSKPYFCTYCKAQFVIRGNLVRHLRPNDMCRKTFMFPKEQQIVLQHEALSKLTDSDNTKLNEMYSCLKSTEENEWNINIIRKTTKFIIKPRPTRLNVIMTQYRVENDTTGLHSQNVKRVRSTSKKTNSVRNKISRSKILKPCPIPQITACSMCKASFNTSIDLQVHLHVDHICSMDGIEFKCPQLNCGKTLLTKSCLRRHVKYHYLSEEKL